MIAAQPLLKLKDALSKIFLTYIKPAFPKKMNALVCDILKALFLQAVPKPRQG
jgi:hypothetical protein